MAEPCTQADIARDYGVTPKAVEHWRGRDDFPEPMFTIARGNSAPMLLYDPAAVKRWHRTYKRTRHQRGRRKA